MRQKMALRRRNLMGNLGLARGLLLAALAVACSRPAASELAGQVLAEGDAQTDLQRPQTRIVGGQRVATPAQTFPYVAQVVLGPEGFCTGSLISPTVVLTAAHCVAAARLSNGTFVPTVATSSITVLLGWTNISNFETGSTSPPSSETSAEIHSVSSTVVHPAFLPGAWTDDVALLLLSVASTKTPVYLDLTGASSTPGVMGMALGFGALAEQTSDQYIWSDLSLQLLPPLPSGLYRCGRPRPRARLRSPPPLRTTSARCCASACWTRRALCARRPSPQWRPWRC